MNTTTDDRTEPPMGIRATRLYDGEKLHEGWPLVVIRGDRIAAVDLTGARPSADLRVVDLGDVTMLPGLIDVHTHLAWDPHRNPLEQMDADDDATVLTRMGAHAQQALRAGITTLRDLGDRRYLALTLRDMYNSGRELGPEVLAAGPPITPRRGHCWFLGGEADGTAGVAAAVAERIARGTDCVKVMVTGGVITPGWAPHESQYSYHELRTIVDLAHEAGKPVAAHAHGAAGIGDAITAGVDTLEHGFFLAGGGRVDPDWRTIETLAARGVPVSTTTARLPEEGGLPDIHLRVRRNFARMHALGVRLVCSSDAGVGSLKPHDCLPHGVIEFGELLGLPSAAALASVTSVAAQACGVGHRKGRVATGFDADLLAVAGNPVDDLRSLLTVRAVYRAGRRVPVLP
ncbi:amidohydrolase family protein [Gandjariella thermophila]|uniref:Amidohydrolase-related domain-containing protein n=1 Tax=Gandjariella thermophila TaxID=1931992 RepID=A0A4D4JFT1_9PSEU|nr:amidohydrolase family protein [Gandjariella thermophila]GDY33860.1 hypothetical protein GTS_54930 [Gandjariella thermophila]